MELNGGRVKKSQFSLPKAHEHGIKTSIRSGKCINAGITDYC